MIKSINFYFDFISPYSYLAYYKLKSLKDYKEININFKPILLDTKDCDTVVFNDNLIHGGALNRGVKYRVSVEFTMLIKEV